MSQLLNWKIVGFIGAICVAIVLGFAVGLLVAGRSPGRIVIGAGEPKTLGDLVEHFRKAGLDGEVRSADWIEKRCTLYSGKDFGILIIRHNDNYDADEAVKLGFRSGWHRNGRFFIKPFRFGNPEDDEAKFKKNDEKALAAFKSFQP